MAIRYSGDAEVRLQYIPETGMYRGLVTFPGGRQHYIIHRKLVAKPHGSEGYDQAARLMFSQAWSQHRAPIVVVRSHVVVRRTFQAPCPEEE